MATKTWLRGPSRVWALVRRLPDAIVVVDAAGVILWANESAEALIGAPTGSIVGRNGFDIIDPLDMETAAAAFLRTSESPGPKQPWPLRIVGRDGESRWVEFLPTNLLDDPSVGAVVISIRPLDGRDASDAEARSLEELFRRAFDDAPIGMALVGVDGRFARVNGALCHLLQRPQLGLLGVEVATITDPDDAEAERPLVDALLAGELRSYDLDKRFALPDGSMLWVAVGVSLVATPSDEPERFVMHVQDITDRRASEAELAQRATRDALTGVANRALFDDRLEVALLRNIRLPTSVGLLVCDIDGLEAAQAEVGEDGRNACLVEVALRLRDAVRPGDTVARFGAEQFVALCEDLISERDLDAIAERITRAVGRSITVGDVPLHLAVRIGKSMSSGVETADELLALATGPGVSGRTGPATAPSSPAGTRSSSP